MNKFWLGPPGTGKTWTLIDQVKKYLAKGIHPRDIAYISFTKVAAKEAKTRAIENFPEFSEKDFCNFRTLHSLAHDEVPEVRDNTMQDSDYAELGRQLPFQYDFGDNTDWNSPFDSEGKLATKNPYLQLVNKAVVCKQTIEEAYDGNTNYKLKRSTTYLLDEHLKKYKDQKGLYDFNDYLLLFAGKEVVPSYKVLIVDEAQDLSLIQWDCIERLIENAGDIHIAGDDDQAIFVWAGASVEKFRSFKNREGFKTEYLKQSRRVPQKIYVVAEKIIERDPDRIRKEYLPTENEGHIMEINHLESIIPDVVRTINNSKDCTWMILASTNNMLKEAFGECKKAGIKYDSSRSKPMNEDKVNAIDDWSDFRQGHTKLKGTRIKVIYGYMASNVKRGFKSGKKAPDDLEEYSLQDCIDKFGLLTTDTWDKAFLKLPDQEVQYIKGILDSGKKLTDPSQVRISTISSIKGGEADNVILYRDISWGEKLTKSPESHRKFYVAVTRARSTLIVVSPRNYDLAYNLPIGRD
tara:strand:- start:12 stop:1574 length:1563 start_codon:yes stop_codon:yes gene_type:complete